MTRWMVLSLVLSSCVLSGLAAEPPEGVNYQGVLRDAAGQPLTGEVDMIFHFYDAESGGSEIQVDRHLSAGGKGVTVTDGLFSVELGTGQILDGSGPGTYDITLAEVFRDFSDVWLEVEIEGETLAPRVHIAAAAYAHNAGSLEGRRALEFVDTSSANQVKLGRLIVGAASGLNAYIGVQGFGSAGGGYFAGTVNSGYAYAGYGDIGVSGYGDYAGGSFHDTGGESYAYAAKGRRGLEAYGDEMGGYFEDEDDGTTVEVATGNDGVRATASGFAGYFENTAGSGTVELGRNFYGLRAFGTGSGGYFADMDDSGVADVANGHYGIRASGNTAGARFSDSNSDGLAYVGYGDRGIWAKGTFSGGTFSHPDNVTHWADVSQVNGGTTYKIRGTGTVSFVQNHPQDPDKVVVYSAPEGGEVAVYTRGSARLEGGVARVVLDPSFGWTANPDVGLTAHLTPRDAVAAPLVVEQLSTGALLVRGPEGSDARFDYMVWGLRIGFEQQAAVQPKQREALLPDAGGVETFLHSHPELREHTALARFAAMREAMGQAGEIDLSAARALARAIDGDRDTILAEARARMNQEAEAMEMPVSVQEASAESHAPHADAVVPAPAPRADAAPAVVATEVRVHHAAGIELPDGPADVSPNGAWLPVTVDVSPAHVVVVPEPGSDTLYRRSSGFAAPGVLGVASGTTRTDENGRVEAWVAMSGVVRVKADAGYGGIRPGDLLVASSVPGHAARALEALPGTVLGKAIDGLELGTGTIRVLLMPR